MEIATPLDAELKRAEELAKRYQFEFVDLRDCHPDPFLLHSIPLELMVHYEFLPLAAEDHRLVVAVGDPTDLARLDELEMKLERSLVFKVAARSQVREFLKKTEPSQRVLEEATEEFRLDVIRDEDGEGEGLSLETLVEEKDASPMVRLVDSLIFAGLERRASDIHVESRDNAVAVKYRIDGVLQEAMAPLAREFQSNLITRIKVMSELDIAERRVPQDGRFRVRYRGRPIDFRVSIMPSIHGEDAVLRILDKESLSEKFRELRLDVLGFSAPELKRFRRFIREPYGMVLVTGPTGSGKTTSLYAALSEIKTDEDKIMVGEIRDNETAQIAIQSALTGHLVFTTVHANHVVDVLGRFLNMGVEPYNFVSALNCIMAQRLVRLICAACKRPVQPSQELLEESSLDPVAWKDMIYYEGAGCPQCNQTGFHGRTAIGELLALSDKTRDMILAKRPSSEIRHHARQEGMTTLRESALDKIRQGLTTLKEINKVTFVE